MSIPPSLNNESPAMKNTAPAISLDRVIDDFGFVRGALVKFSPAHTHAPLPFTVSGMSGVEVFLVLPMKIASQGFTIDDRASMWRYAGVAELDSLVERTGDAIPSSFRSYSYEAHRFVFDGEMNPDLFEQEADSFTWVGPTLSAYTTQLVPYGFTPVVPIRMWAGFVISDPVCDRTGILPKGACTPMSLIKSVSVQPKSGVEINLAELRERVI